jgi:hypothetical protein
VPLLFRARDIALAADAAQRRDRVAQPAGKTRRGADAVADCNRDQPSSESGKGDQARRADSRPLSVPSLKSSLTPTEPAVRTTSATSTTRREPSLSLAR